MSFGVINISAFTDCSISFCKMLMKEFYPLITVDILENVITFTKTCISINDFDLRIVRHCRKPLLFSNDDVWKKKSTTSCFNITMGSYDGADIRTVFQILFIYLFLFIDIVLSRYSEK